METLFVKRVSIKCLFHIAYAQPLDPSVGQPDMLRVGPRLHDELVLEPLIHLPPVGNEAQGELRKGHRGLRGGSCLFPLDVGSHGYLMSPNLLISSSVQQA